MGEARAAHGSPDPCGEAPVEVIRVSEPTGGWKAAAHIVLLNGSPPLPHTHTHGVLLLLSQFLVGPYL